MIIIGCMPSTSMICWEGCLEYPAYRQGGSADRLRPKLVPKRRPLISMLVEPSCAFLSSSKRVKAKNNGLTERKRHETASRRGQQYNCQASRENRLAEVNSSSHHDDSHFGNFSGEQLYSAG
jgi:hypothetical protein